MVVGLVVNPNHARKPVAAAPVRSSHHSVASVTNLRSPVLAVVTITVSVSVTALPTPASVSSILPTILRVLTFAIGIVSVPPLSLGVGIARQNEERSCE